MGDRRFERTFLGYCYPLYCLGRWDEALALMDELDVEDRDATRLAFGQGYVAFGTAILAHRGQLDEAASRMAMFAEFETSPDVPEQAEYACANAVLLLAQGSAAQAVVSARRGIATLELQGVSHYGVKESLVLAIEAAIVGDDLNTAAELLALIEGLPTARRPRFLDAHVLRFKARLADRQGDIDGIDQGFTGAAGLFREMRLPFPLAVTLLEHGEWLTSAGRIDQSAPLVHEAGEIFRSLGATPWLDRVSLVQDARAVAPAAIETITPTGIEGAR